VLGQCRSTAIVGKTGTVLEVSRQVLLRLDDTGTFTLARLLLPACPRPAAPTAPCSTAPRHTPHAAADPGRPAPSGCAHGHNSLPFDESKPFTGQSRICQHSHRRLTFG